MATNSTKSASLQSPSPIQAKKRLEDALVRLETALDTKEREYSDARNLQNSLLEANKNLSELRDKNSNIAGRLDLAIERMRSLLGND